MVATVALPFVMVTVAPASACGVAQFCTGQASTVPLMLKSVTVRVTVTDCALPTVELLLSIAAMVIVPVYVPGAIFTADALTPNEIPVPGFVPELAVGKSQELLVVACHATGRAQVPLSLNPTGRALELASP